MQAEPQTVPDTIALLATLLREELRLPKLPPRVLVYNTNWDIPQTNDLFLVIGILTDDNFGEGQGYSYDPLSQNLVENQIVARSTTYTVDAFSVTTEARRRRHEILFALQGDAAQRLSERHSLRIFRPTPFVDLSHLEASRRLNRYQTQFAVFEGFGLAKSVPIFTPPFKPEILINA
jgi:hypothetical protein